MQRHYSYLLALIVALLLSELAVAAYRPDAMEGGWWVYKDTKDYNIRDFAEFAMEEHNKQESDRLIFMGVYEAWFQVLKGGIKYRINMSTVVDPHGPATFYEAIVWAETATTYRELISFSRSSNQGE